jgi:hypothetical protein
VINLQDITEAYQLISSGICDIPTRNRSIELRKAILKDALSKDGFKKVAFDTRRIDQGLDINPRRGLQNYHRSEAFLSEAISQKLKNFSKLKKVLDKMKSKYEREPAWQDSYARVLHSTLSKGLRSEQKDDDFTDNQPGVGNLDYIEELLHVRYRLTFDDLTNLSEDNLEKRILDKDEELSHKDVQNALEFSKRDVATQSYDTLLEKLFGNIHATKENPEVERTVTITIKDKFVE